MLIAWQSTAPRLHPLLAENQKPKRRTYFFRITYKKYVDGIEIAFHLRRKLN
jgi:hypothetical protein